MAADKMKIEEIEDILGMGGDEAKRLVLVLKMMVALQREAQAIGYTGGLDEVLALALISRAGLHGAREALAVSQ